MFPKRHAKEEVESKLAPSMVTVVPPSMLPELGNTSSIIGVAKKPKRIGATDSGPCTPTATEILPGRCLEATHNSRSGPSHCARIASPPK
jgi:hypothetical protein